MAIAADQGRSITLEWKLSEIQREFFESDARYRTLVAGRRFGKNIVALASQIDFAFSPEGYSHGGDDPAEIVTWWVGPSHNQTRKYGFNKAKELIPDELIDGKPKRSYPFEIPLVNGAQMEFYTFRSPQSLDGAGVDDIVIDERGYMDDDVWESNLAAMLLDTDGRASFIGKPWPSDHFEDCYRKGLDDEIVRYAAWHATSYDNPFIPDERIDELFGDLPEQIFNREIMAEFGAAGSLLTKDMLHFEHASNLPDRPFNYALSVDLGIEKDVEKARENDTDYFACALWAIDRMSSTAYLADIHRKRGMSLRQGIEWVSQLAQGIDNPEIFVEATQAQEWFVQEAKTQGLNAVPVKTTESKEDRLVGLSIPFENGAIKLLNRDVDKNLGYDPRWKDFIQEWLAFPDGDHDDMIDAVGIGAMQVHFISNSIFSGDIYDRDE